MSLAEPANDQEDSYNRNRLLVARSLVGGTSLIILSGVMALLPWTLRPFIILCIIAIGSGFGVVASLLDQFESRQMGERPERCWLFRLWDRARGRA